MKNIVITILVLIMPLSGTILSRSTIEEWEGSLENAGWTRSTGGDGDVLKGAEDGDPNSYQTQAHGEWSLDVYDPNNTSYANAYKTFSNSNSEYMTELYIWIWSDRTAPIDSFPLCVLWNMPGEGLPHKTDIALVIDTLENPPNGGLFTIHVQDADSIHHNEAIIDYTDRWYKIQIYRHISGNDTVVTFYFDGDSIDTYIPINKNYVSNKISLGTTQADSLADGEVFYDDIIIATPPVGEHPRLLFKGSTEITAIRNRKYDTDSTILGKSFEQMADSLRKCARNWITHDTVFQKHKEGEEPEETVWCYYPYSQPDPHTIYPYYPYWTPISRAILLRLETWAFIHFLYPNDDLGDSCAAKAESALVSISSNWRQWTDPQYHSSGSYYSCLDTGYLLFALALAYDMIFDNLNNYQKLTIENSLYSLALGQFYLNATASNYEPGSNPTYWPNGYAFQNSALGFGGVVVSPENDTIIPAYVNTALARAHTFFDSSIVCDTMGGYVEGMVYGTFSINAFTSFFEAYNRNPTDPNDDPYETESAYLKEFPYFRLYSLIPDGTKEVNFCDSWKDWEWHEIDEIIRLAAEYQDKHIQWYLSRKGELNTTKSSFGFWTTFAPFLWLDASLDTVAPDTLPQCRHFPDIDWIEFRTGWQDNDCLLALKSGHGWQQYTCWNHSHYDQNHFIVGKDGKWLIADWGYGKKYANWHNVVTLDTDTTFVDASEGEIIDYCIDTIYNYGCAKLDAADCYDDLDQCLREAVFILDSSPFIVLFDRIVCTQSANHKINWWLHTFGTVEHNDSDYVEIDHSGTYLDVSIMLPDSTHIDTSSYQEHGRTYRFINVVKEDTSEALYLAVLLLHDGSAPSAAKITGERLIGTKVYNRLVMFSDTLGASYDSLSGGRYEVSVTDSLSNIVCNLVPDTNYLVITKRDTLTEDVDTLQTNDVGILSFKLNGSGGWKVIITLARVTGSIKINNDSTYCNMPFVELDIEMTNPLDSNSVDSMRIWQDYTVNDTLYTDSTGWIPFDSTYFWYLQQDEGTNVIYAQFAGNGWNESIEYCDSIVFDRTSPTGSFVINDDSTFANNSDVTLKSSLAAADTAGAKMRFGHEYLKNVVKNSGFDTTTHWQTDAALYHDSLELYEIPLQTIGNYFYQAIAPESLADFVNDTVLLWIDLVSDGFVGDARVAFQYIYGADTAMRGTHPYGASITIPEGTNATVSHYNLYSYFKYYPDPQGGEEFIEARIGVFADSASRNSGSLFIDNLRLDVVSPADSYTRFEDYDTLKEWTLMSGNGVRTVYGQFSDGAGNETTVSFDSIIVDTTKPARRISSPQNGQTISGTITITGWAHDSLDDPPHFKQYKLQHQSQMSANWYGNIPDSIFYTPKYPIGVGQGQKPVALGDWNTTTVNDGWYDLKLTVADLAGNSNDTTISVCVNNGGEGEGGFSGFSNYVYGLASGNEVYIGEFRTGKIYQYNTNYELIDTFKLVDSVGTGFPLAIAIDDSGKLWVANTNSHLISKFTPQGSLLLRFAGGFSMPSGFAFDYSGNIWVSDRLHHKIKKFNQDGDSLCAFGTQGTDPGEINRPIGLAYHDDKLYIADSRNKRISVFDTLGNFIEIFADSTTLSMPFSIVIDSAGCLFVSDFVANRALEYDPFGNPLYQIDTLLDSPTSLALSPNVNILYVSDTRNKRVLAFQVRGEPPDSGGGPQAYGDSYFDRLMFNVYPSLSAKQMNIRLQGFIGRKISLKVYDVTGRLIKTFYDNQMIKANQSISWDCKDDINRKLANGVYFVRLVTEGFQEVKKVILLK